MTRFFWAVVCLLVTSQTYAQTASTVRLAILSENQTQSGAEAADVLTAQLSGNPQLHLLERDEIARVYREQALAAANKNYVQVGRALGADGLLLVNAVEKSRQETNITLRLIAIKPGVVLADEVYGWPVSDVGNWSRLVMKRLAALVPKLMVLPKDAVPISVVGFQSPNRSNEAQDTEQQLQLLTIERLTREQRVFALERRKMQALMEEKELKADASTFWSGAYLFEAAIDQAGYSPETITINARLTPAAGGAPLLIDLSGSRTNLPALVNDLVLRAIDLLKVKPTAKPWNAADEAAQYSDEAKWHLKWKSYGPAQEAADSAWAMGKQDLDCGVLRMRSAVGVISRHLTPHESLQASEPVTYPLKPNPGKKHGVAAVGSNYLIEQRGKIRLIHYISVYSLPDRENIERATRMLAVYEELSRRFTPSVMTAASVSSGWKNSDWYNAGVEALSAASEVLENFHLVSQSAVKEAESLVDLRVHIRAVADWIENAPAIHASYYITNEIANHDTLIHSLDEAKNIFSCTLTHGAFWNEKPDETISTYRRLMSTPAYCYIHQNLWLREPHQPRLVTWPANDAAQISAIWSGFIHEMESSTNLLWRLEAKAFALADASTDSELGVAFTNLFTALVENGPALAANPVEQFYMVWRTDALVSRIETGIVTSKRETLGHQYHSQYSPKLEAFDRDYWDKTVRTFQTANGAEQQANSRIAEQFNEQKKYLKENRPFNFKEFVTVFRERSYSKAQAEELLPLIRSYRSNLTASVAGKPAKDRAHAQAGNAHLSGLEMQVNFIVHPPAATTVAQNTTQHPITVARPPQSPYSHAFIPAQNLSGNRPNPRAEPEVITNVQVVTKFLPIPLQTIVDGLEDGCVLSHQWVENKLVLDFQYSIWPSTFDKAGHLVSAQNVKANGVAILDLDSEKWRVVPYPALSPNSRYQYLQHNYHSTTLFNGEAYLSYDGKFWLCDKANQWHSLEISDGNNYQLFSVNGHLYATDSTVIFEIVDGGKSTKLLASARRRPAKSALDLLEFGSAPALFPGPTNSLRTSVAGQLFSWTGSDWRADGKLPMTRHADILPEGVLFCGAGYNYRPTVTYVANSSATAVTFFQRDTSTPPTHDPSYLQRLQRAAEAENGKPIWQTSEDVLRVPQATRGSDLYMLLDHSRVENVVSNHVIIQRKILPEAGCHAKLLHFVPGQDKPKPQYLKFEAGGACPPVQGGGRNAVTPGFEKGEWMLFVSKWVLFGAENPMGVATGGTHTGCPPGVWICPTSKIE